VGIKLKALLVGKGGMQQWPVISGQWPVKHEVEICQFYWPLATGLWPLRLRISILAVTK